MDSLPKQHIDSLPKDAREAVYWKVSAVCVLRGKGLPEDVVADKAKFESVEDMYFRLKHWGLSGLVPLEEKSEETSRERKARGSGLIVELPPADNATPLFREKLEVLIRATEELGHRKEKRQGKRFIQSAVTTAPVHYSREVISDEAWKNLSEHYGFDPGADCFSASDARTWELGGGASVPEAPLPVLIGMYLLAGGDPEPLVEALHNDPASAEWSQIKRRIEGRKGGPEKLDGLKALAEQLALLIRGGTLKSGAPPARLTRDEINLACRITEHREAQVPEEKIYEKLRYFTRTAVELPWDEFRRLADLELRWPWA